MGDCERVSTATMTTDFKARAAEKSAVARWSLMASLLLVVGKLAAAWASGSLGLLSEAFHSMLDFAATAVTLFAIQYADRPADDDHPFGHAKMESVAALIETAMLFAVTAWIVYEAITRLLGEPHALDISWWVLAVIVASILIDYNRSRALQRTAERTQSDALAADALHFRADMWSSCAVFVGLLLSWYGFHQADAIAALVVAVFVAKAAWGLGQRTLATLLDAAPAGVTAQLSKIASDVDGVLSVAQLRARPAGPTLFVDMTVNIPRTLHVTKSEEVKTAITSAIRALHPAADISIIANPVALDDETAHDKIMHIASAHKAAIHHVTVQDNEGRLAVSFDYEVDGATTLVAAHDMATSLETAIRDGLGADVEVESHIEPSPPALLHGKPPKPLVARTLERTLQALARRETFISDLHNIRIRATEEGLFVHYHCRFDPHVPVQTVHDTVDRIENALMKKVKGIARVVAHAEPTGHGRHRL
jgi:cation diffusion facilitator family transporter